jgi:nucleoside-diphosphate-sugar epimerase
MKIAILGATSQIARDLIHSFAANSNNQLHLFGRRPDNIRDWIKLSGLIQQQYQVDDFSVFPTKQFDVVINFVGVGNPAKAVELGNAIFDITVQFDQLVLDYLKLNPSCRYIFMSSGAAYATNFSAPVDVRSPAIIPINNISPSDWYGIAKLHAECRHRAQPEHSIVDIRIFNYFSRSQDLSARYLISDIIRAIRDGSVLKTSSAIINRDFMHPSDFYRLIDAVIKSPKINTSLDAYTQSPIDKQTLLSAMQENFGLQYEIQESFGAINATGAKPYYYSLNKQASELGYNPQLNSLEGVLQEASAILK